MAMASARMRFDLARCASPAAGRLLIRSAVECSLQLRKRRTNGQYMRTSVRVGVDRSALSVAGGRSGKSIDPSRSQLRDDPSGARRERERHGVIMHHAHDRKRDLSGCTPMRVCRPSVVRSRSGSPSLSCSSRASTRPRGRMAIAELAVVASDWPSDSPRRAAKRALQLRPARHDSADRGH